MFARNNSLFIGSKNLLRRFASTNPNASVPSYKLVVIGGGTGGLAVSSTLSKTLGNHEVAVIEPSDVHYYQPLWTFVGAGLKTLADSAKPTEEVMSKNAYWIKSTVAKVQPDKNLIELVNGQKIAYDYLVVATGLQCYWDKIKGLPETLGKNGVTSNYSLDTVEKTWEFIREFKGGNAIFTMPSTPIKCPGAAVKIAYLAEDYFTKNRVRNKSDVIYNTSTGRIFSIDKYAQSLERVAKERGMVVNVFTELKEVDGQKKEAVFDCKGVAKVFNYNLLHVTPPMGPPSFIGESGLGNPQGFVDVDKYTLQHVKYPNIFSLGDSSSAPTSKTAAAISVQSGVLKKNLLDAMSGKLDAYSAAKYDGYASCPLLVGKDKIILAEFSGYTGKPMETFPVDQGQERSFMYWLTKEVIPEIYWSGLVKGTWTGPQRFRNLFSYLP